MEENINQMQVLLAKIESMVRRQERFSQEIEEVRKQVIRLQGATPLKNPDEPKPLSTPVSATLPSEKVVLHAPGATLPQKENAAPYTPPEYVPQAKNKSDLEKFIGENLINKVGIIITILGVAIGTKYSIDHNLIAPLTRVVMGYLTGATLILTGMKLKRNYENYSAVLVSGGIANLYFVTYFAYDFYSLMPQTAAFALMVIFTLFTVIAELHYNRQVIAHIGLVGAYAVPFLLSDGSGRVVILFSYISIINAGILFLSFRKQWKSLYYASFALTWLIFAFWYASSYSEETHFLTGLIFSLVFFLTFYATFISYKLLKKEQFRTDDIVLLLCNAFFYFAFGFAIVNYSESWSHLNGLFTLFNAFIHFIVCLVFYHRQSADPNLFYMVGGLVLVFITIAIPVQLDGNPVTLLWAGEAVLLFTIGRKKGVLVYENIAYPLMALAFLSIIHDWQNYYDYQTTENQIVPLLNINFLSSVLFTLSFGWMFYVSRNTKAGQPVDTQKGDAFSPVSYLIATVLILSAYFSIYVEIEYFWQQKFAASAITTSVAEEETESLVYNENYMSYSILSRICFSFLFISILAWIDLKWVKNEMFGIVNMLLLGLFTFALLVPGLYELAELRGRFMNPDPSGYFHTGSAAIVSRYITFTFFALALYSGFRYWRRLKHQDQKQGGELIFHTIVVWIASSELMHWLELSGSRESDKLGLSILWGCYSLVLIAAGIRMRKKHLRIAAITLFGVTLIKLFFYDLTQLDTIAKTIVFIALGVLLLIISFLYNKYKNLISDEATG